MNHTTANRKLIEFIEEVRELDLGEIEKLSSLIQKGVPCTADGLDRTLGLIQMDISHTLKQYIVTHPFQVYQTITRSHHEVQSEGVGG
jgi:hypothetical protein